LPNGSDSGERSEGRGAMRAVGEVHPRFCSAFCLRAGQKSPPVGKTVLNTFAAKSIARPARTATKNAYL